MSVDAEDYRQFTGPAELHKAVNTLRGLVAGMTAENGLSDAEAMELANWCALHSHLRTRHPFSELLPVVESALSDGELNEDESKDILWLCSNFVDEAKYYDVTTSAIQFLSGFIHGVMADGVLTDGEIETLRKWIQNNDYLRGTYPFDELDSLIHATLADGVVSEDERGQLTAFFGQFIDFRDSWNLSESHFDSLREKYSVEGICAHDPAIAFAGKAFCFTGKSTICDRDTIADEVTGLGGKFRNNVSQKTDYLVVGNDGNPCWAFSCYGRKVEEAIALRKAGATVTIVNERDFWTAVTAAKGAI